MARYRRRRFYRKRKYNIENRPLYEALPRTKENNFYQNSIEVVPASTVQGVRKVTRLTVSLVPGVVNSNVFWALVYIPEGVSTTALFPNTSTLFEPSNYVLASGISDGEAGPIRISSRISKNLNAGDRIYLLTASTAGSSDMVTYYYTGLVRYAICFN